MTNGVEEHKSNDSFSSFQNTSLIYLPSMAINLLTLNIVQL